MNCVAFYKVFSMIISSLCLLSDMSKESKLPITDRCRSHCPDGMVNSCSSVTSNDMVTGIVEGGDMSSSLMTRSLDPALLYTSSSINHDTNNSDQSESSSTQLVLEDCGAGRKYGYIMPVLLLLLLLFLFLFLFFL